MSVSKANNNDWSACSTTWGNDFEIEIETKGNEAKGEVPHVTVDRAVGDHVRSADGFDPGDHYDTFDFERVAHFATAGVDMIVRVATNDPKLAEHAPSVFDVVDDELADEWSRVDQGEA